MDIVSLKPNSKGRFRRGSERRHTTEVTLEQLPSHHTLSQLERDSITSMSNEDLSPRGNALSPRGDAYHHPVAHMPYQGTRSKQGVSDSSLPNGHQLASSWGPKPSQSSPLRNNRDRAGSTQYFKGSQVMFGEDEFSDLPGGGGGIPVGVAGHQYQLSYELALDNVLTPFANPTPISSLALTSATSQKPKLSDNPVMEEVIATEITYVRDVREIIDGYLRPFRKQLQSLPVSAHQINALFGNIRDISDFHSSLLDKLLDCKGNVGKLGECFLRRVEDFKELYTLYCTNYPYSIQVLMELSKVTEVSNKLKSCQKQLQHLLPLGAYLLKPVQRILRYHLLLTHMVKKTSREAEEFSLVVDAMLKMTEVAEHINSMKRKYDTAVHVQEIQNLIRGHEMQMLELTKYGVLVLEDSFRFFAGRTTSSAFRGRTDRYVFLFQRLYLVTKKEEDGGFQYKMHVEMKDLQLTERVEKEPTCYQIRQVSTGRAFTFQARHEAAKEEWVRKIKLLLVESIPHLPDKARMLIMSGFEVHTDHSPARDRRSDGIIHMDRDIGDLVRKTQSLGRHASPQLPHLHGSPPLGSPSKGTRHRHQTSPVPIRLVDSSLVSSVHDATFMRSESPSHNTGKSRSHAHTEVISEVQYEIGATYSPKSKSLISLEEEANTDSSSSSDGYYSKEATPSYHTNGGEHVHHFSSPPGMGDVNLPSVPSLFGQSHSAVRDSDGSGQHSDPTTADTPELDPPPGFGSLNSQDVRNDVPNHKGVAVTEGVETDEGSGTLDEEETLFNELMSSSSSSSLRNKKLSCMEKKTSSTNLDWGTPGSRTNSLSRGEGVTLATPLEEQAGEHDRTDSVNTISDRISRSSSMDDGSTPKASPYTSPSSIRRWSVKKRRSYDHNDPDEPTTPKTSPYIRRHHSANIRSASSSSTGSDNVFSLPFLDPPTPFRNPAKVERLGPFPDENLEALEDERESKDSGNDSNRNSTMSIDENTSAIKFSLQAPEADQTHEERPHPKPLPPDVAFHTSDIAALALSESTAGSRVVQPGATTKKKSSRVKRSHSFGSNKRTAILHTHDGSLSTDNSPLPSPKFKSDKTAENSTSSLVTKVRLRRRSKGSPAPPTTAAARDDLGASPDTPHIHTNVLSSGEGVAFSPAAGSTHSLILPPPAEFKGAADSLSVDRATSTGRDEEENRAEKEERSLFSFFRIKHNHKRGSRSGTPSDLAREDKRVDFTASVSIPLEHSEVTPREESPLRSSISDLLSFDEALESYDQYATQTGKMARSVKQTKNVREALMAAPASLFPPSPSPSPSGEAGKKDGKKKNKKKKRHGYTVANIDSDTMKAVKKNLAEREHARKISDSRVQQLAREYSQRIKERTKMHSTVFEDEVVMDSIEDQEPAKPVWLAQLTMRKRQSSTGNMLDMNGLEDVEHDSMGSGDVVEPHPLRSNEDIAGALSHLGIDNSSKRHTTGHVHQHRAWVEEEAKTGKLKGWVRSIAAKFAKKEGTTL